jgi:uncharacterized RDD family membrane protein YckC
VKLSAIPSTMKLPRIIPGAVAAALFLLSASARLGAADVPASVAVRAEAGGGHDEGPPFGDQAVPAGRTVREVVGVGGTVTVDGSVERDAVSVFGRTLINGEGRVQGSAVAVLGRLESKGVVGRDAVAVFGDVEINGPVGGDLVAVLGNVRLGPNAIVQGDLVRVGGSLRREPGAVVRGSEKGVTLPAFLGAEGGFVEWVKRCVFLARPLAFDSRVAWAWSVALAFLAVYLLIALAFRRAVAACADTLVERSGLTALGSLLTIFLTPVAFVVLSVTIVGLLVVPFLAVALGVAALFGKAAVLVWLGRAVSGRRLANRPVLAVLVGGGLVLVLYCVPVVGFLVFKLLGWLGLGMVATTLVLSARSRRTSGETPPPVGDGTVPFPPAAPIVPAAAVPASNEAGAGSAPAPTVPPFVPPLPAPCPKASLGIRLGALAIDVLLVGMVLAMLGGRFGGGWILLGLAAYGAVLWKLRGATVGSIILGLKVVRADGRELDWATVVVRALGCFLSLAPAGLGFLWVAFDAEKQAWHDKIAGTWVVRAPRSQALI